VKSDSNFNNNYVWAFIRERARLIREKARHIRERGRVI
jgi:hypothetical protein